VSNKASAGTQTGTAAKLSLTQQDMIAGILKEQIWKCWNAPSWLAGGENLRPTIKFNLKPDGALDGLPENAAPSDDPAMRTMAESAMRAIQECAPYKIPAQFKAFYEDWKKFSVTFDMKEVL
jgi:colicin import membrane protein